MKKIVIREEKRNYSDYLMLCILFVSLMAALLSGIHLYRIFKEYGDGVDAYEEVQELVIKEQVSMEKEPEEIPEDSDTYIKVKAPLTVDFEKLQTINPDIIGWIYIEGIPAINYPVVKGKDNEYYLHRTYEKTDNFSGSIFIDCENSKDFTDCNTIIYGHNMKNGSMFGKLKSFKQKEMQVEKQYIWILTPDGDYRYQVFSAYTTGVGSDTYTLILGPGMELLEYGRKMQEQSEVHFSDHSFEKTDRIITLSTCTGNDETRFVVQAVLCDKND